MAVTLKQIADKVGVDVSVVSRVLNDKTENYQFTEERMDQIRKTASELGYIPNISARAVKNGSFGCVALLLSSHGDRSYLPNHLLDSIHAGLEKQGKHLLLTKLPDAGSEDFLKSPKVLRTLMADGLIIDYTHHVSSEIVSQIENHILPSVWINIKRENDTVYPDNFKAGADATRKLIKLGHKNIAYVTDVSYRPTLLGEHYSIQDRFGGYAEEMKKAGLKPNKIDGAGKIIQKNEQLDYFLEILSQPDRPTAMVLYWSSLDVAMLRATRIKKLQIPEDLSLITFASCSALDAGLSVNAMIEPESKMGEESVKMLCQKIKKPEKVFKSKPLKFSFSDVGSCGKPRSQ